MLIPSDRDQDSNLVCPTTYFRRRENGAFDLGSARTYFERITLRPTDRQDVRMSSGIAACAAVGVISIVVITACGTGSGSSGSAPSAASTAPATASPAVAWQSYVEPDWGYSINMPVDWHEVANGEWHLANPDHPEQDKFSRQFSNEAVANNYFLPLDDTGIVFQIFVVPVAACSPPDLAGSVIPPSTISIDGSASTVVGFDGSVSQQAYHAFQAQVGLGKYCYSFVGATLSASTRDTFLPVFKAMLAAFKVGTPTTPPF
jgi:hypothetical protein